MRHTDSNRAYRRRAALGIVMYLALALAPTALMLLPPLPPAREPLREFAVALGFSAIGLLGMQFALASRLSRLKAPYGIDAVYYFHRKMAVVALGLTVLHPVLLIAVTPERIALLNVFTAPRAARFGVATVLALAMIVVISLWRLKFRLSYEMWRGIHGILALTVLGLASLHIMNAGDYTIDWKLRAFIVYPLIWAGLLAYTRLGMPIRELRYPYGVEEVRPEAPGVWSLSIRPEGHDGLEFRPGQFAWFTFGRSPFSIVEHPFSFSSSPLSHSGGFEITVKELGDFTSTIGQIPKGTVVYVEGPFGAFTLDRYPAPSYVFLAGGIGITPIMSILRTAILTDDSARMTLIYAAKTQADLAFADELDRMSENANLSVTYVLQQPPAGWGGPAGYVTRALLEKVIDNPESEEYFVCGPPAMMKAVEKALAEMGVRRLHYERFSID